MVGLLRNSASNHARRSFAPHGMGVTPAIAYADDLTLGPAITEEIVMANINSLRQRVFSIDISLLPGKSFALPHEGHH